MFLPQIFLPNSPVPEGRRKVGVLCGGFARSGLRLTNLFGVTFRTCVMRTFLSFILLFNLGAPLCQGAEEGPPIQQWIDEAIKQGGGVVTIPPGVHVLKGGLMVKDAKKLAIRGMDKETCVLKLPPLAYAECAEATPAGSLTLPVRAARHLVPGMRLHLEADGAMDAFTKKPKPFVLAVVAEVQEGRLRLKEALAFPIPAGTVIRHEDAPNLIEIRGASDQVEIANLTLDGGSVAGDPPVQGHAQLCGVFAASPYSYEKGPTGPKIKGVAVRDCILQNLFGRGVAFYSVENSSVERCSIRDANDEAVDLDHFTTGCIVRGNQIIRCRIAFEMNDANTALIEGNEARDCQIGVSLWRWCPQPGLNEGNVIRNNLFQNMSGNALQIGKGTARNVFEANEIDQAGRNGFSLSGEAQVLRGNVIRGAGLKDIAINEGQHEIETSGSR